METGLARHWDVDPDRVTNVIDAVGLQRSAGRGTQGRSERHSEVRSERDGVGRRRVRRPTETDGQICLDEISLEEAVFMLDGPAVVHQGRKSHCRLVYDECRA